ncbi:putative PaaI_thioesterase family protein [Nadsonia fulvescens var. elongata DSM 6958]|uniref:Putative PaaI_thioesterase family protein n=1 Tax=Nadsonia fulvescens var. elongata DSM 6958 TaxID=857566 RepID=A0A1E3PEK5_9ASCO|nr:putative PaaI_thioesterase family protein [Nadsonia fulvescens var. elongata DSM 6958]
MSTLKFVRSVWSSFLAQSGLEPTMLNKLRIMDAKPGKVLLQLKLEKKHTNRLQILHGGTIASIVDLGGSLAVSSRGLHSTGVSTDINVTYISSGGKIDDLIDIDCTCQKLGKTLAFTTIDFYDSKHNLFARGSHTKFIAQAYNNPKNRLEEHKA